MENSPYSNQVQVGALSYIIQIYIYINILYKHVYSHYDDVCLWLDGWMDAWMDGWIE